MKHNCLDIISLTDSLSTKATASVELKLKLQGEKGNPGKDGILGKTGGKGEPGNPGPAG